nr:calphotin-like [Aegilops tauschii subsp. strangulata]
MRWPAVPRARPWPARPRKRTRCFDSRVPARLLVPALAPLLRCCFCYCSGLAPPTSTPSPPLSLPARTPLVCARSRLRCLAAAALSPRPALAVAVVARSLLLAAAMAAPPPAFVSPSPLDLADDDPHPARGHPCRSPCHRPGWRPVAAPVASPHYRPPSPRRSGTAPLRRPAMVVAPLWSRWALARAGARTR